MQSTEKGIGALTIHCIDYRFISNQRNFLKDLNLKDNYDLISYPGASKDIEKLLEAVDVSVRLHHPGKIILVDHEDCGAFGDKNKRTDHEESLRRAQEILKASHPNLPVELYLATFAGVERV